MARQNLSLLATAHDCVTGLYVSRVNTAIDCSRSLGGHHPSLLGLFYSEIALSSACQLFRHVFCFLLCADDTRQLVPSSVNRHLLKKRPADRGSIMRSESLPFSLTKFDEDDDDGEDEDDGNTSGEEDEEEESETNTSFQVHKNETNNAKFLKMKSAGNGKSSGEGESGEDTDNKLLNELEDEDSESGSSGSFSTSLSPRQTQYSNSNDSEEDDDFPDEEDEEDKEDKEEEDEDSEIDNSAQTESFSSSDDADEDKGFSKKGDEKDEFSGNEAGSTGESPEFSRGSDLDASLSENDISRLVFPADKKTASLIKMKEQEYQKGKKRTGFPKTEETNGTSTLSRQAQQTMANNSKIEGKSNATDPHRVSTENQKEQYRANITSNSTSGHKRKQNNTKENPAKDPAKTEEHPKVKQLAGKTKDKALIPVLSHSASKHLKSRFHVPREKFLGRGVSVPVVQSNSNGQPSKNVSMSAQHSPGMQNVSTGIELMQIWRLLISIN